MAGMVEDLVLAKRMDLVRGLKVNESEVFLERKDWFAVNV